MREASQLRAAVKAAAADRSTDPAVRRWFELLLRAATPADKTGAEAETGRPRWDKHHEHQTS